MFYHVSLCYEDAAGCMHCGIPVHMTAERLELIARNFDKLRDPKHVTNCAVMLDSYGACIGTIFQAGGYSYNRGMFVDMYGADGSAIKT